VKTFDELLPPLTVTRRPRKGEAARPCVRGIRGLVLLSTEKVVRRKRRGGAGLSRAAQFAAPFAPLAVHSRRLAERSLHRQRRSPCILSSSRRGPALRTLCARWLPGMSAPQWQWVQHCATSVIHGPADTTASAAQESTPAILAPPHSPQTNRGGAARFSVQHGRVEGFTRGSTPSDSTEPCLSD
jgi:hypothetical protein